MNLRTRNSFIASAIIATLLSIGIGCGHDHNKPTPGATPTPTPVATPSPTPPPAAQHAAISTSLVPGMHVHAAITKTTVKVSWPNWLSLPKVEAATNVVVSQNWEGICQSSPATTGHVASIVLFGVGQTVDQTCSHSWFDNDSDGSIAAGFNATGKIVYGDGTLSNLVVSVEHGTVIGTPVIVTVWVKRSGTALSTGITCALAVGNDEQICQSTATFAVQNLDRVLVTISRNDGDSLVNLNAAFTKSIP
jgi:hypothetical protein